MPNAMRKSIRGTGICCRVGLHWTRTSRRCSLPR